MIANIVYESTKETHSPMQLLTNPAVLQTKVAEAVALLSRTKA
jgi:hypothetical protein